MSEEVLAVLLRDIDNVIAVLQDARLARKFLGVCEKASPLRLQQVDHVQVFALRLCMAALRGEEVNMRIPAKPSLFVHIDPAFEAQCEFALPRFNLHSRPKRLVFKPACDINDDLAARQPALAGAVYISVGNLSHAYIAAYINVPSLHIRVDLIVVTVRLISDAFGRSEMNSARRGLVGFFIKNSDVHPISAAVKQFHAHPRYLDGTFFLHIPPFNLTDLLLPLLNRHRRRGEGCYLGVGGTRFRVLRLAPTFEGIVDKIIRRCLRQGVDIGCEPSIYLHVKVERFFRVLRVG